VRQKKSWTNADHMTRRWDKVQWSSKDDGHWGKKFPVAGNWGGFRVTAGNGSISQANPGIPGTLWSNSKHTSRGEEHHTMNQKNQTFKMATLEW